MSRFSTRKAGSARRSRRWWDAHGKGMPRILGGARSGVFRMLLVCAVLQAMIALAMALFLKNILSAVRTETFDTWSLVGLMASGLAILACRAYEANRAEYLGQSYVLSVRTRMLKRIVMQSDQGQATTWGITMARMISDLNALRNWVAVGLARGATALISLVGVLLTLALIEPLASLVTLCGITFCVAITLCSTTYFRKAVFDVRRWRGRLASRVGEQVMVRRAIRQFGQLTNEAKLLRKLSKRLRSSSAKRMTIAHSLRTLPQATLPLTLGLTILVVAIPVEQFAVIVMLQSMAANALREAIRSWDYRISFAIAQDRIANVFHAAPIPEAQSPTDLPPSPLSLEMFDVQLPDSDYTFSGRLKAGAIVRLPSKSSVNSKQLFDAFTRSQPHLQGTIKFGDVSLDSASLTSLARTVQVVSPNIPLLRGTVAKNLSYGRSPADLELERLCQLGELNETATALSVAESGSNLPSSLHSLIVLLRASRTLPGLLLVDDEFLLADPVGMRTLNNVVLEIGCTTIIATDTEIDWVETDWCPELTEQTSIRSKTKNIVPIKSGTS